MANTIIWRNKPIYLKCKDHAMQNKNQDKGHNEKQSDIYKFKYSKIKLPRTQMQYI